MIRMCSAIFRMAVCTFPRDNRSPGLNKLGTCYYCVQFFSFFQHCINFSLEIFASGTVVGVEGKLNYCWYTTFLY